MVQTWHNRINSIHKRALKLVNEDSHDPCLQDLLPTGESHSVCVPSAAGD